MIVRFTNVIKLHCNFINTSLYTTYVSPLTLQRKPKKIFEKTKQLNTYHTREASVDDMVTISKF